MNDLSNNYLSNINDKKYTVVFVLLGLILTAVFAANIMTGSVKIGFSELLHIIGTHDITDTNGFIVWNIRIPRALGAVLGGAYLSVAGLLLQVFFSNPIVGPFILGISSGATLMVSIVMLTGISLGFTNFIPFLTSISGLAGAYATMAVIIVIAAKVKKGVTLLIAGLMMGYLCHAVTSILVVFAEQQKIKGFVLWQLGSFSGLKWTEIELLSVTGGLILILVYSLSKSLNVFLSGETYALTMGLNLRLFRFLIIFCACALAGMVTASAGPVAFIGLAVPHMARLCFSTSDNRILIPGTILTGAVVTVLCDLAARQIFSPVELPISAITAFFGAPVVIGLLMKKRALA